MDKRCSEESVSNMLFPEFFFRKLKAKFIDTNWILYCIFQLASEGPELINLFVLTLGWLRAIQSMTAECDSTDSHYYKCL